MAINAEALRSLKQVNVSSDKDSTMTRVRQLWSETPAGKKKQVLDAAHTGSATIYRIFKTGAITPRITLVMASILGAAPLYLTGDAPENDGYEPEKIGEFIRAKGLTEPQGVILDDSSEPAPAPARAEKSVSVPPAEASCADGLSEEGYILQLRALYNRAAFGVPAAKDKLDKITDLLFSC